MGKLARGGITAVVMRWASGLRPLPWRATRAGRGRRRRVRPTARATRCVLRAARRLPQPAPRTRRRPARRPAARRRPPHRPRRCRRRCRTPTRGGGSTRSTREDAPPACGRAGRRGRRRPGARPRNLDRDPDNFAAISGEGEALVDGLAKLTGADVAASDDLTGNEDLGGDWELEYRVGQLETSVFADDVVNSDWTGTLDAEQVVFLLRHALGQF